MQVKSYKSTVISCYFGNFSQAIVLNMIAILFVPLMNLYNLSYGSLGTLILINFITQIFVDFTFSKLPDKYGFRPFALIGGACFVIGLWLFASAPSLFPNNIYIGFVIATVILALAGGLMELLLSPMVNAVTTAEEKVKSMGLLHSTYAWGMVGTILLTTIFVRILPLNMWYIIPLFWSIIPVITFIMWLKVPMIKPEFDSKEQGIKKLLVNKTFLLCMLAILFGGAAEVTVSQWASAFVENGLKLDKVLGDLLGPCLFAVTLALGRGIYSKFGDRIDISNVMIVTSFVTILCYALIALSSSTVLSLLAFVICGFAASLLWPGTLVIASNKFPLAGAWLFAFMAAAGDIGAAIGPYLSGLVIDNVNTPAFLDYAASFSLTTEQLGLRLGMLVAALFPLLTCITHVVLKKSKLKNHGKGKVVDVLSETQNSDNNKNTDIKKDAQVITPIK